MRILINATGSHGDVLPFIALAREFQQRGHDARLYATAVFEPFAREAGLSFKAFGSVEDYESLLRDPDISSHFARQLRLLVRGHGRFWTCSISGDGCRCPLRRYRYCRFHLGFRDPVLGRDPQNPGRHGASRPIHHADHSSPATSFDVVTMAGSTAFAEAISVAAGRSVAVRSDGRRGTEPAPDSIGTAAGAPCLS